jgi:hypothetical protein
MKRMVKGCHKPEQFQVIFEKPAMTVTAATDRKLQKNVTVFTTPTCSWCTTIKRHLQEHGINTGRWMFHMTIKRPKKWLEEAGSKGYRKLI